MAVERRWKFGTLIGILYGFGFVVVALFYDSGFEDGEPGGTLRVSASVSICPDWTEN